MKALRTLISDWLFWLARKVKPRRNGPTVARVTFDTVREGMNR